MDLAELLPNKKRRSEQAYELQTGRWRSFLIRNNQQTGSDRKEKNKERDVPFSFKRLGISTADDQTAHIMPRHKYIYISDKRGAKLCLFYTPVHVLNYWSYLFSPF